MSRAVIESSALFGTLGAVPSKSAAHRMAICAFLSGESEVRGLGKSEDIEATLGALEAISAGKDVINCGESGSTLRFLIPVAAALGKAVTFTGRGRLPERPIGEYLRLLPEHGVKCESKGGLPLKISGRLTSGRYEIEGNISSQYITGLLLALPLLDGDSEIVLVSPLQSKPYVEMTLGVMRLFGVEAEEGESGYFIKGNQKYNKTSCTVEGDWSQAAFFLAGGALTGEVTLTGLDINSAQGDKRIVEIMKRFGAVITVGENSVSVKKSGLSGIEVDVSDIPDMVPAIAVLAANAKGKTVITGAERLRIKESDRIKSITENLKKMGVEVNERPDGMDITGSRLKGAKLDGFNDHRIVMAFSIAALCAEGKTVITDAMSVNKSYPEFFSDYRSLGGKADVICDRK